MYTPASTALFACPRPGRTVSRLYRHIRQAAIPARVVLGEARRTAPKDSPPQFRVRVWLGLG